MTNEFKNVLNKKTPKNNIIEKREEVTDIASIRLKNALGKQEKNAEYYKEKVEILVEKFDIPNGNIWLTNNNQIMIHIIDSNKTAAAMENYYNRKDCEEKMPRPNMYKQWSYYILDDSNNILLDTRISSNDFTWIDLWESSIHDVINELENNKK